MENLTEQEVAELEEELIQALEGIEIEEFEIEDEGPSTEEIKVKCNVFLPNLPATYKVGSRDRIATEHEVRVTNDRVRTLRETIKMEYTIPGIVRRAFRDVTVTVKRGVTKVFRFKVGPHTFKFRKKGTFKLSASTRFLGEISAPASREFKVE